jgi:hypothetical protein
MGGGGIAGTPGKKPARMGEFATLSPGARAHERPKFAPCGPWSLAARGLAARAGCAAPGGSEGPLVNFGPKVPYGSMYFVGARPQDGNCPARHKGKGQKESKAMSKAKPEQKPFRGQFSLVPSTAEFASCEGSGVGCVARYGRSTRLPLTAFPTTTPGRRTSECRECRNLRQGRAEREQARREAERAEQAAKAAKAEARRAKAKARREAKATPSTPSAELSA